MQTIGLASDHAGFELKQFVKQYLEEKHIPFKDYGTYSTDSCDYPDFAHALANGMKEGEVGQGIAICGSGEGISMTLNKHQHVRAALVWIPEIAHMTRLHNDANVLCMGARIISEYMAWEFTKVWLSTEHLGGKYAKRVEAMMNYEKNR